MNKGQDKHRPDLLTLFLSFLRLGSTAFGGPAMVAYIAGLSVKRKKWLDDQTFKDGVALCSSIPGATAMQSAAYVGLRTRGVPGALASFIGFGLPAFVLMVILSSLYVASRDLPWVTSLFRGLQVIVVAVMANATHTFGRSALRGWPDITIACAAACSLWFGISPFYVVLGAAAMGIGLQPTEETAQVRMNSRFSPVPMRHILILLLVIAASALSLYLAEKDLFVLSLLMIKIDLFAFGGGFASIPLMLQEIVNVRGWMDSKTFMDGIALGQVTPGPIVITATFVGYLLYGLKGAAAATIAIFTPSFTILILGTKFFDRLRGSALFSRAIKGILASFVGLLLYVTVKFGLAVPWNLIGALMGAASFALLLWKIDIIYIVPIGALLSILIFR
jgi:chromate transporter